MALITISNNLSAKEEIEKIVCSDGREGYNPGALTGPKKSLFKFNDISIPLPRTNLQVVLPAGGEPLELETDDDFELVFFKNLEENFNGAITVTVKDTE